MRASAASLRGVGRDGAAEQLRVEQDGGDGGLHLVGQVADERLLPLGPLAQRGDVRLDRVRHGVEVRRKPGQLVPAAQRDAPPVLPPRQGGRARAQLLHGSERARDDPPQQQPGDEEHGRAGRGAPGRQRGDARGQAGNVPHEAEAVFLRAELERAAQQQIARAADAHGPVPLRPVRREGMAALEQRLRRKAGVVGEIFRPQQQRIFLRAGRGAERVQDAAAPHERALPRLFAARGAHGRAEALHVRARLLQRGGGRIRPRKAQHQRAAGGHRRHDQQHRAEGQPRPELHHQSSRR